MAVAKHKLPPCICCKTNKVRQSNANFCFSCDTFLKEYSKSRYCPKQPTHEEADRPNVLRLYVYKRTFEKVKARYEKEQIETPNHRFNFPFLLDKLTEGKT